MKVQSDLLLTDIGELVTMTGSPGFRRGEAAKELSIIRDASLASCNGKIVWTGKTRDLSKNVNLVDNSLEIDVAGKVITPGFVDSHTHPLYDGTRQVEFAMRATGADYEDIAAAGGGILNSVGIT